MGKLITKNPPLLELCYGYCEIGFHTVHERASERGGERSERKHYVLRSEAIDVIPLFFHEVWWVGGCMRCT